VAVGECETGAKGYERQVRRMASLIYSMIMSVDGYTEDEHGEFGWGAPEDEAVHSFINELGSSFGTYLYGRRMYETMVYWETAHTAGLTHHNSESGLAGKPCLLVKFKLLDHLVATFR
jgi:dihydrofolate reductase